MALMFIYELNTPEQLPALKGLEGVTIEGNKATFGPGWTKEAAEQVLSLVTPHNISGVETRSKGVYDDGEREALIKYGVDPDIIDQLDVREVYMANDILDRQNERFESGYLKHFAAQINGDDVGGGIPFILNHLQGGEGKSLGTVYSATVKKEGDVNWLVGKVFYNKSELFPGSNLTIKQAFQQKRINRVSIGFYGQSELVKTGDTYVGVYRTPKAQTGAGRPEAIIYELSAVTTSIQAQYGAAIKNFKFIGEDKAPAPVTIKPKEMIFELNGKSILLKSEGETITGLDKVQEVVKELTDECTTLKARIADLEQAATARKGSLIDKIKALGAHETMKGQTLYPDSVLSKMEEDELDEYLTQVKTTFEKVNPQGQTTGGKAGGNGEKTVKMSKF